MEIILCEENGLHACIKPRVQPYMYFGFQMNFDKVGRSLIFYQDFTNKNTTKTNIYRAAKSKE